MIKGGCTRTVFLIGKYAIKIPRLNYGWQLFLKGLLCNMQEVHFNTMKDDRMAPIYFSIPGGWLVVMARCKPLTDWQFKNEIDLDYFWNQEFDHSDFQSDPNSFKIPVEYKQDSFGWYRGKIVAIDYGS